MIDAAPNPNPSDDSRFSPLALWISIRKNWVLVVTVATAVTLGGIFFTFGQTKIYEADSTVMFDPQPPRPLGNQVQAVVDVGGEYLNNREYYKTQYWVIQSQRIAVSVVKALGLNRDPGFIENRRSSGDVHSKEIPLDAAAQILRARLTVDPIKDSRLANVSYRDADPNRAQRVLRALVDNYVQYNLDDTLDAMNSAGDWLAGQVDALKNELENSELALHSYRKEKNILSVSMDDQSNMLRAEMVQLTGSLTGAKARREQIAGRQAEINKINPEDPSNIPATELLNSPLLQQLRSQYVAAVSARDALLALGKGPNHPEVQSEQAKVESAKTALLAEVKNLQAAVQLEINAVAKEMNGLGGLLEDAKQRGLDLNLLEIEYNRLHRTKENSEKLYAIVTERSKENDLTRMLRINNIRVVDHPQLPERPVSPNPLLNIAGSLVVGLLLGLSMAIGREQMDRSIKTPDDAERELQLSVLGVLPSMEADSASPSQYSRRPRRPSPDQLGIPPELVVHHLPTSGVAEAARSIRTNIMFMFPDKPFRRLLVTSAAPAEGKTTVACCIAVAMAQTGRRVALLDCDMRRPRVHRVFGLNNDLGLTSALLDVSVLDKCVFETEVPNLSVVTTGPIPPNPVELLHSDTFQRVLEILSERFSTVVIDSPPVAPVTDAAVLATKVDGVVLVVRAFKTTKDMSRRAARSLRDVGGPLIGTILNAANFDGSKNGYYQYYYRQEYASHASESEPASNPQRPQA